MGRSWPADRVAFEVPSTSASFARFTYMGEGVSTIDVIQARRFTVRTVWIGYKEMKTIRKRCFEEL
jgi:hypothetical protein